MSIKSTYERNEILKGHVCERKWFRSRAEKLLEFYKECLAEAEARVSANIEEIKKQKSLLRLLDKLEKGEKSRNNEARLESSGQKSREEDG